jgi:hypothetical protein
MAKDKDASSVGTVSGKAQPKPVPPNKQIKFSEKTVEWAFARNYFDPQLIAAPLAGNEEAGGDAMLRFSDADSWLLIEFKGEAGDIRSERKKYAKFEDERWEKLTAAYRQQLIDAFDALSAYATHTARPHFLVYGEAVDADPWLIWKSGMIKRLEQTFGGSIDSKAHASTIELKGLPYWCGWNEDDGIPIFQKAVPFKLDHLKSRGAPLAEFKAYLRLLLDAKGQPVRDDGGDGWGFGTVMAMDAHGAIASFSVFEFARMAGLLQQAQAGAAHEKTMNANSSASSKGPGRRG